jgi:outer membrane protein insertion porin family
VEFQGNKKLDDEKLRDRLTITSGSIADTSLIQGNADVLTKFYSSKGFALAEVVPVIRRVSDAQAVLTYQISEGPKVKIKKIEIVGNKAFSKGKIKGVMKTGKWWPLSFLFKKGYYEKSRMDADIKRIKNLYFDNGYIQAAVTEPEIEISKDKKRMTIVIRVSDGEQFNLSSIDITGNTIFTEAELREKLTLEPGAVFSKGKMEKDIVELTDTYGEKGYAAVAVLPDIVPEETTRQVKVTLRINEGGIYSVGKISISGNHKTRDKVIRREVRLNEGDTFDGKLLKRSYQRITNTNFFEEVKLVPRLKHREKTVDLDIAVKEKKTGSVSLGVGYSSEDKMVGMIEYNQANFRGAGQNVKVKAELGSVASSFSLSFSDPWFLDRPVAFSTSLYNTKREYGDYTRKSIGFSVGLGKEFKEYWRGNIVYSLEEADITDVDATASATIREQEGERITSSISPSVSRDTRDNFIDPHTGSRNSASLVYAGLGGDNRFLKFRINSDWFFPVTERTTLAVRGRYGHATGLQGRKVPLYERFYVGGIHSVRGFGFGEAGPRDENDEVIGGLNMLVFNTEFIFPLSESLRLKGVVFFDTGTAYDGNIDRMRYSAGGGVRWLSPMGPIRLEWGRNLDPQLGESKSKWEFAIGAFF